jgi:hypothetical protein
MGMALMMGLDGLPIPPEPSYPPVDDGSEDEILIVEPAPAETDEVHT